MSTTVILICNMHHAEKEWRLTTFEYQEEGITIRVPGVETPGTRGSQ